MLTVIGNAALFLSLSYPTLCTGDPLLQGEALPHPASRMGKGQVVHRVGYESERKRAFKLAPRSLRVTIAYGREAHPLLGTRRGWARSFTDKGVHDRYGNT